MPDYSPDILAAYREWDREVTIRKFGVACFLGATLVPAFTVLDHFYIPQHESEFLKLRLLCALLIGIFYGFLRTNIGRRYYRVQGVLLFMLPASCITWMIYRDGGGDSPYYAGLNLVLMVLAFVLDWTFWESFAAVSLVLLLYMTASMAASTTGATPAAIEGTVAHLTNRFGVMVNNLFFLVSTGVIIITGSYFHTVLRLREFASQFELRKSRETLATQNTVLEETLKQLKETELQLIQTEKIVSLGRLSAGIIHEINNPLNFATTALYTLRNQGARIARERPAEFAEILQDINDGLQRVKNIVSDLRSFTHPDAEQLDVVHLSDVVTASLRFLSNEWKDKVTIEQRVPAELVCRANRNKLMQVFVNLLQNALDALKNRPDLGSPPVIQIGGQMDDDKVVITVRDNGEGIDPQNLARIFDPFFTTRDVGKGMGMGLSICYRIIQDYRGQISVRSERGKYCEFTVTLPAADPASIAA